MKDHMTQKMFAYRHVVSFEETNVVGNVYYSRHISWQGRCREMFLREYAPGVLHLIEGGLKLVTLRVACDYFDEFRAFDEVDIQMRLHDVRQHIIALRFDYFKSDSVDLMASGEQTIGCMRDSESGLVPVAPPDELLLALEAYTSKKS